MDTSDLCYSVIQHRVQSRIIHKWMNVCLAFHQQHRKAFLNVFMKVSTLYSYYVEIPEQGVFDDIGNVPCHVVKDMGWEGYAYPLNIGLFNYWTVLPWMQQQNGSLLHHDSFIIYVIYTPSVRDKWNDIEIIFVCFPQFLLKSLSYIRDEMNTYNIIITG